MTCQRCGRSTESEPVSALDRLSWVMDREGDTVRWTCTRCATDNVRAMEAKLEPEWW